MIEHLVPAFYKNSSTAFLSAQPLRRQTISPYVTATYFVAFVVASSYSE